ncbi:MAG: hypothetical protein ABEK50_15815 [bacterium]
MQLEQAIKKGALWGALATLVMTLIMLTGMGTGVAPMPEPIPKALASLFLGMLIGSVAKPVVMITGMVAHFAYGAGAGVVFAYLFDENSNWKTGLLWGGILWVIMQIAVLPIIGWGFFGLAITGFPPKIAVGTFVLHLIYGGILGWGVAPTGTTPAEEV